MNDDAGRRHDALQAAAALLQERLRRPGEVWLASITWRDRDDVEVALVGGPEGPSAERLQQAALCVASLDALVPACERALDAVPDGEELFPPRAQRRWYFEGLSFELDDPVSARALFTQNEPDGEWEYLYVLYFVEISEGRAVRAFAQVR